MVTNTKSIHFNSVCLCKRDFCQTHTVHVIMTKAHIVTNCVSKICCEDVWFKRININTDSSRFIGTNFALCGNGGTTIFECLSPKYDESK